MMTKSKTPCVVRAVLVNQRIIVLSLTLLLCVGMAFGNAAKAELPVVTGEQWAASDRDSKLAFLLGIGTMVKVEQNLIGDPPPPGTVSFAPSLAKGIGDLSLTEVMNRIDAFYRTNPDSINKAVIAVIWEDIAIPRLEGKN